MKNPSISLALAAATSFALVSVACAAPPIRTGTSEKGAVLTDAEGMTLYTFDGDSRDKSACTEHCADIWPPLQAAAREAAGGGYTIITRGDGARQWAYKNKPLYTFARDQKPGDTEGDGIMGGTWHAARP